MGKPFVAASCLFVALGAFVAGAAAADDPVRTGVAGVSDKAPGSASTTTVADASGLAAGDLLAELQAFLQQRDVDIDRLTVDRMVGVMIDWYRAGPVAADNATDMLLFRYGGWSEGCATGFNVSLMRRAGLRDIAGITLMFEPSGGAELAGFSTALTGTASIDAFLDTVRRSPAFRQFGTALPMGAVLEKGGLR